MQSNSLTFEELSKKGTEFLNSKYAILGGAMSWVSDRNLVSALSNAGGFGVIACGAMTPDLLRAEIKGTKALTDKSFGVNLITMHPLLEDLITVTIEENVTHVVLAGRLASSSSIKGLKEAGIKVIGFAPALIIAKKLIKDGVDALIVEGCEAGGHIGPVSTTVLSQEVLLNVSQVPVFVAGGIGKGQMIASFLKMGAAGCQLGTRFVCAHESRAHPNFKKAFIKAHARDAQASVQLDSRFPVIPVRALANKASQDFTTFQRETINKVEQGILEMKEAQLQIEHFWSGALRKAVIDGDTENGSLMDG